MYSSILVPLDGSKRAEKILTYIEDLAFARESTLLLLQVIEPSAFIASTYDAVPQYTAEMAERLSIAAKSYLSALADELRAKGFAIRTLVEYGPVVQTILGVAEREKTDLIALASHGRTGLSRAFYGSVAAGILSQADRPLLVIRSSD